MFVIDGVRCPNSAKRDPGSARIPVIEDGGPKRDNRRRREAGAKDFRAGVIKV